ncbi:MAG: hypothetical protein HFG71_06785 [Hungatella sp.]|jgi:hypothetical protein|nr:hypothetical protein [Hungatella sp.]
MSDHLKHLVLEMSVGMFAYVLILGGLAVIFQHGLAGAGFLLGPVLVGLFLGFAADVAMLVHMAVITERAAESRDEGYANRMTVVQSAMRRVVFIIALVLLGSRPQVDAVAMIIGALGLKAGALLQPAVHRTFFGGAEQDPLESTIEERRTVYGNDENSDGSSRA